MNCGDKLSARTILAQSLLLAGVAGLMGCQSDRSAVDSKPREQGSAIHAWTWVSYTRPDGTMGFWDPKPVIAMGATLVNVIYTAQDRPDRVVYGALHPPKLLAEVMANCQPELAECHQHGIKVIGYANTVWFHPDMLKREGIDSTDLAAIDNRGKPVINSTWEKRGVYMSCVNNPKWLELQKTMVLATADAGFDGLQFDLHPYAVPPGYNCHCQYCQQGWKNQSRQVFGTEKPMPGADVSEADFNKLDFNLPTHRVYREWRHQCLAVFLKSIEKHVRRMHPAFLLSLNHGAGDPDFAVLSLAHAIQIPSSELWHLKLGEDSSLYAYRLTEALSGETCLGLVNFAEQIAPDYRFQVAVAEAYAGGGAFYFGPTHKPAIEFARFLREHQADYVGTASAASVGVLYSWRDQEFVLSHGKDGKPRADLDRFRRAAAVLSRKNVPYDALVVEKGDGLKARELARYGVIVAPELRLLSARDSAALETYVRAGGCLLSIGPLGTLREVKNEYVERPSLLTAWTGNQCDQPWRAELGSGRVAYVPLAWTGRSESEMVVTSEFAMAADYLGLYSQLRLTAGTPVEATVRGKGNSRSIHLMRFGPVEHLTDRSVELDYELPKGFHVASATAFSPEFPAGMLTLTWKESKGRLQAVLNPLGSYALIAIQLH
jgi:hypothetical protein